jgi:energy-converting hydrogenase Eha subunit C
MRCLLLGFGVVGIVLGVLLRAKPSNEWVSIDMVRAGVVFFTARATTVDIVQALQRRKP